MRAASTSVAQHLGGLSSMWRPIPANAGSAKSRCAALQRRATRVHQLLGAADTGMLPEAEQRNRRQLPDCMAAKLDGAVAENQRAICRLLRLQIAPHLGAIPLQRLKPQHIATWHGKLIAGGLCAQTVTHAHRVLSLALKQAVEHGTLTRNPAATVKPPRIEPREIEILAPAQIAALMTGLADHPLLYPIAVLALATGSRRGELLALEWADLDLDRAVSASSAPSRKPNRAQGEAAQDETGPAHHWRDR